MSWLSEASLEHLIATYGPWAVFAIVTLESTGLPLPGESLVIAAAVFAGTSHEINPLSVVLAAAGGAILGDNLGYLLGRTFGYALLRRFWSYVGLDDRRLRLGELLFAQHGGKIVLLARFVAFLRVLAALLAGANAMPWRRFVLFNGVGGVLWGTIYGLGGYFVGSEMHRLAGPIGVIALALGAALVISGWLWLKRSEARLQAEAERGTTDH